jgi:tetratricopeptide (TPR) repeat protein
MTPATPRFYPWVILGTLILLFASFSASSQDYQSKYERDLHTQAFQYLELKEFESSQRNYEQLVKLVPDNWLYICEFGLAYLKAPKNKVKSIQQFERAIELSGETFGDTIPELIYYLGRAYQLDHQFEEAMSMYGIFTEKLGDKKNKATENLKSEIDNYVKMCQHGIYHLKLNEKNPLENKQWKTED